MKKAICIILALTIIVSMTACRRAEHYYKSEANAAKYDVKNAANNFDVMRRITVLNTRTDSIVLQIEGYFSLSNNSHGELEVTLKEDNGNYRIDYIYLNENTMYVIEDITPNEKTLDTPEVHFGTGFGGKR